MRFPRDHAPPAPPWSFWVKALGLFLLLAGSVSMLDLAVDPFDFRFVPHLPLARGKETRRDDTLLWSVGEFRRLPQRALDQVTLTIVGDSRAESLCGGQFFPRIFKLGNDRILNLAVGGAAFPESLSTLQEELPHLPKLRGVIFSAPIERVGIVEHDRSANATRLARSPVLYALSLETVTSSIALLRDAASAVKNDGAAEPQRPDVAPDALVDPTGLWMDTGTNLKIAAGMTEAPLKRRELEIAAKWREKLEAASPTLLRERISRFIAPLSRQLRSRGIGIVFFFPPLNPAVRQGLPPTLSSIQADYQQALADLGTVEDFSSGRPGLVLKFNDSSHVLAEVARVILTDIYQRDFAESPQSSGDTPLATASEKSASSRR